MPKVTKKPASEPIVPCGACRLGAHTKREVYLFSRAHLCATHRNLWDAADDKEHRSGCPWFGWGPRCPQLGCPLVTLPKFQGWEAAA